MSAKTIMTHSITWKFLNAQDPWECVRCLLEYYDIPLECHQWIVSVSLPMKIPVCPVTIKLLRVHNSKDIPINTLYAKDLGGDLGSNDNMYYDVAKTLYTPTLEQGKREKRMERYQRIIGYECNCTILCVQGDWPCAGFNGTDKKYMVPSRYGGGNHETVWHASEPVPSAMRKEDFWPEFRHYIQMCNLDEHQKYSTKKMYTKLVKKYGGAAHYKAAKACEHTRLYTNVGNWRKYELARAYPTLYGKGGWAKK
jgi:hypothetical protein